jgi:hydrogenase-4 component H
MKYPKLRELKEAIRALVKGPYTSRFSYQPHTPYERFRGRPYFHEEECVGCAACAQVCPAGAIEYKDVISGDSAKRVLAVRWDICICCGNCQANCPTEKGITLSQEFAYAATGAREELAQQVEKEFALCEACGAGIVPRDQMAWVARKLGPLNFSNASLLLFYFRSLALSLKEAFSPKREMEFLRADRLKILCPKCRREAVIKS